MKRKWFVLSTITAIAMVGMFAFENIASAHQLVRNKRQHHTFSPSRVERINPLSARQHHNVSPSRVERINPLSALNNSWIDLTFGVKANQETLAKALPIYQETRDALQQQIKEARKSDERRTAVKKLREAIGKTTAKFNASLKEVLTEEQMTQLTELTKRRRVEASRRVNQLRRNPQEARSLRRHR